MEFKQKDVPGFEDRYYLDPNDMNVISKHTNRPLKLRHDSSGYPEVHLSKNGKDYYCRVHRLFAEAYIPNPDNLPCVNHKDENKTNFSLDNLEWCTYSYNIKYGIGSKKRAESISSSHKGMSKPWVTKRLGKPVLVINENGIRKTYSSAREAARQLNIRPSKVADVLCGLRKSTHGYTFSYISEK